MDEDYKVVPFLYVNERVTLLNSLANLYFEPNIRNFLYGNTVISAQVNVEAFEIIQCYISETGQF